MITQFSGPIRYFLMVYYARFALCMISEFRKPGGWSEPRVGDGNTSHGDSLVFVGAVFTR